MFFAQLAGEIDAVAPFFVELDVEQDQVRFVFLQTIESLLCGIGDTGDDEATATQGCLQIAGRYAIVFHDHDA